MIGRANKLFIILENGDNDARPDSARGRSFWLRMTEKGEWFKLGLSLGTTGEFRAIQGPIPVPVA